MLDPAHAVTDGEGNWYFDCSTTTVLTIILAGVSFPISPLDYVGKMHVSGLCKSRVVGQNVQNIYTAGNMFFKSVSVPEIAEIKHYRRT
jgi:hypothetical protein